MKKLLAVALMLTISAVSLVGCGSASSSYNIEDVMTSIEAVAPVAMPADMDEAYLTSMYEIDMADVEEFVGKYSNVNVSSDEILIVKAAKGKAEAIKTAAETRRDVKAEGCEMYLESEFEKSKAGRVVVKGDYVIFVIAGDAVVIQDEGVEKAYEAIDKAIDEATK